MKRAVFAGALSLAVFVSLASGALAASGGPSCIGLASSAAPKPGNSGTGFTGGRATVAHLIKVLFTPPGSEVSSYAQIHATDFSGCPQ